jgi:hypothetical protein
MTANSLALVGIVFDACGAFILIRGLLETSPVDTYRLIEQYFPPPDAVENGVKTIMDTRIGFTIIAFGLPFQWSSIFLEIRIDFEDSFFICVLLIILILSTYTIARRILVRESLKSIEEYRIEAEK